MQSNFFGGKIMVIGGRAKLLLDDNFTILDGDDGFYALSGYTKEEFISICGNKCKSNMQGMDYADILSMLQREMEIHEFDFRIYTKQNTVRWVHAVFDIIEYRNNIPVVDGLFYDVTNFKTEQYEKKIIFDNIPGAVVRYLMDDKVTLLEANTKFYDMCGTTPADYHNGSITRLTDNQRAGIKKIIDEKAPRQEDIKLEYKTSHKDTGKDVWIHWEGKYVGSQNGIPVYLAVLIDISREKELEKELEATRNLYSHAGDLIEIASKDPLTGLDNRSSFHSKVEAYRHSHECRGQSALLMLDIDGFKNVNDTCGHLFGDDVLCQVSNILKDNISDNIFVGRFGGDEFLIFMKHADMSSIETLAVDVNSKISAIDVKQAGQISCSIGCIITSDVVSDYNVLLKTADDALYNVKISGKNSHCIRSQLAV
jgi:putative two-component system response regulator